MALLCSHCHKQQISPTKCSTDWALAEFYMNWWCLVPHCIDPLLFSSRKIWAKSIVTYKPRENIGLSNWLLVGPGQGMSMLTFWFRRGFEVSSPTAALQQCPSADQISTCLIYRLPKPQGVSHLSWGAPQPPRDFGGHVSKACPCQPPTKEGQEGPQAPEQAGVLGSSSPAWLLCGNGMQRFLCGCLSHQQVVFLVRQCYHPPLCGKWRQKCTSCKVPELGLKL